MNKQELKEMIHNNFEVKKIIILSILFPKLHKAILKQATAKEKNEYKKMRNTYIERIYEKMMLMP
ncbi:MAG: hypothetical protein ABFC94_06685 [Syntrophomonas sp.]